MKKLFPKRALLSVSDKTGLVPFARALVALDIALISTGGTATALQDAGLPVTLVEDLTGFPEIMDGRVKTLHPKVHGGILGRTGLDDAVMESHGILPIQLVVVNFYPFTQSPSVENIDVGGPTMVRAAAKNHAHVAVLTGSHQYDACLEALQYDGIPFDLRKAWAAEAFGLTARYDAAIHAFLAEPEPVGTMPRQLHWTLTQVSMLRYGENPHQSAALYAPNGLLQGLAAATLVQGKPLSYNNWVDADAALACIRDLPEPACAIIKHANPCGVALGTRLEIAYEKAYESDPQAAFGGIIAFNRVLDELTARRLIEQQFVEVIICAGVDDRAALHLQSKPNVRVLVVDMAHMARNTYQLRSIEGGVLMQTPDDVDMTQTMKVVTTRQPTEQEWQDLRFAWHVVKHVKSNAIVVAKAGQTFGIGGGQTSRVASVEIALEKAKGFPVAFDAVLASDAFFPFPDSIERAAASGIKAIIQPGGSVRDAQVIAAAEAHGMAMVFTGIRHFYH